MLDLTFNVLYDASAVMAALTTAGLPQGARCFGVSTCDTPATTIVHLADDATDAEKTTVNNTINTFNNLPNLKADAIAKANDACTNYIYEHYDQPHQASLNALMTEGVMMSYPNRLTYIGGALTWIKSVISYYYTKQDAINAATDAAGVAAVTWDFAGSFDASDPAVVLRTAQNMTN